MRNGYRQVRVMPAIEAWILHLETHQWAVKVLRAKSPHGREQVITYGTGFWGWQVAVVFTRKGGRFLTSLRRYYVARDSEGWASLPPDAFKTFVATPRRRHAGTPDDEVTARVQELLEKATPAACSCGKFPYTKWSAENFLKEMKERRDRGKSQRREARAYRCPQIPARWHITSKDPAAESRLPADATRP